MRLHDAPRIAFGCGALLMAVGGALVLRDSIGLGQPDRELAGVGTGPDTVGLVGTLLAVEGLVLLLAGLFVLRTASGEVVPATGSTHEPDVTSAQVVTIGGGLASFALVDRLRMAGVAASDVVVVSTTPGPTARFTELCRTAGLGRSDRLRSDSAARMDNIWGFPGYAASEARRRRNPMPVLRAALEPVTRPYAPTVGLLVDGVDREAERIGWRDMTVLGEAYRITEVPGGYLVHVHGERDLTIRTRWVHLALGSAGSRLPEEGLGELDSLGRQVDDDFCISRSGTGGIVASGMTATGAPADSFLGLQSAALSISHTFAESGVGQPLTPLRSLRSWWNWMKGTSL